MPAAPALIALAAAALHAPAFVHPGVLQSRHDLALMKAHVAAGRQPWRQAWSNLLAQPYSSLDFQPKPHVHIARGSFGANSTGDRDLTASANAAWSHALQWSVTGNTAHAAKAIAILDAWSAVLWDFEGNDAKLLAAWTAGPLVNAAEILRYTNSGWSPSGIRSFQRLLRTVYHPLLRGFFPEANGNWDGAIIEALLSIGVFLDDRAIFDAAAAHYLRGRGNGGIAKYVYPSGQCDESARDQGHTQLGLDHFARSARVAASQNVDLWSAAHNRLALGFEYTARYMLGEDVPAYGVVSPDGRGRFRDAYEAAYDHYHGAQGIPMPYTARAVAQSRPTGWLALVFHRGLAKPKPVPALQPHPTNAGAQSAPTALAPPNAVLILPGQPIQPALDRQAAPGGWVVLAKGLHIITASLRLPSGVTLSGQGRESVLYFDPKAPAANVAIAIVNASDDLRDVTLRDFLIEASTLPAPPKDPNQDHRIRSNQTVPARAGIALAAQRPAQMRNLRFAHLTVRNSTHNGVALRGAAEVTIDACDFSDNGASVVPGPGLQHNLLITRSESVVIKSSRFDDSPAGNGIDLTFSRNVVIESSELARNAHHGLRIADSQIVRVESNLLEANDHAGLLVEILSDQSRALTLSRNTSQLNAAPDRLTKP